MNKSIDKLSDHTISTESRGEQLYSIIRDAIMTKKYKVGDKLPSEIELSSLFSISKSAVREGLGLLISEGLIEKRRGHKGGSFVSQPTPDRVLQGVTDIYHLGGYTLDEVLELRSIIEPVAIKFACSRRTEDDLTKMRKNLQFSGQMLEKGKVDRKMQIDFHRLIAVASKNRLIATVIEAALIISKEITQKRNLSIQEALQDYKLNEEFYDCILNRKATKSSALMKKHFSLMESIQKAANDKENFSDEEVAT